MKKIHSHNHAHEHIAPSQGALKIAIVATSIILIAEFLGALWTNSLALFSDVTHVLGDLASFCLSYFAILLAQRPISDVRTFGWHRIEVFASIANALTVFVMAFFIFLHSIKRMARPEEVLSAQMLLIASIGLAVNLFVIWKLHPHLREDINIQSAYLHALGDALASVAVVGGGILMLITKQKIIDPACAMIVAFIIIGGALKILREAIHILLEGVPKGINQKEIIESIEKFSGQGKVVDFHVWNICSHLCALTVHILVPECEMFRQKEILEKVNVALRDEFDILHSTIQIESELWHDKGEKTV